jgi:hypothetical protein
MNFPKHLQIWIFFSKKTTVLVKKYFGRKNESL